jgi:hypothetical protein
MIRIFQDDSFTRDFNISKGYAGIGTHLITDPPYTEIGKPEVQEFLVNFCIGNRLFFCPTATNWAVKPDEVHTWVKPTRTMNFSKNCGGSSFIEKIMIYRDGVTFNELHWQQMTGVHHDLQEESPLRHPFQKPYGLLRRLVLIYTKPGDLVIDPFMGSGVLAEVCYDTKRLFLGIEKDGPTFDTTYSWLMSHGVL